MFMKKISILLLVITSIALVACGKGEQINGHNTRTAYKSIKMIKNRLPSDSRIEYEVSFWTIRDSIKDDSEFLAKVDGKNPQQIVELAKEFYKQRKNAGSKEYEQYSSWEEMIAKFGKERINQDRVKSKRDMVDSPRDNVMYKLDNM
jgi:hypothetical protein